MSDIVNSSLRTAAKGTGMVLAGSVIALLLGFINKLLIIRNTTQAEFGIFSLALAVVSIVSLLSTLGLKDGSPKYISTLKGKNEKEKAKSIVISSLQIGLIGGVISSFILYNSAEPISVNIFNIPDLSEPLKIISISLPLIVLSHVFIAIFRGYGIIKAKTLFQDILRPIVFFIAIKYIFSERLTFINIIYGFVLSFIILFLALIVFAKRKHITLSLINKEKSQKELITFSVPLLVVAVMWLLFSKTDTLMLGYFRTSAEIGLYNAGVTIAKLITIPLGAVTFVFIPIAGDMYSKNQILELKRTYQILTKWIFFITLPIFVIFFIFPENIVNFLFGERYIDSSLVLMVLSLAFIFNTLVGVNGMALITLGKSKELMWIGFLGTLANISLNYLLIPIYGVIGAAIASMFSFIAYNIIISIMLYKFSKIHPFTFNYLKPNLIIFLFIIIYSLVGIKIETWMIPLFLILFSTLYILTFILTKSVDSEDFLLIEKIIEKADLNISIIKR